MKKVILSVLLIAAVGLTSCKSEKKDSTDKVEQTEQMAIVNTSVGVRGNCGMCKAAIEKAANAVDGVTAISWDKDKKKADVSFDSSKTNLSAIEKAIAAAGYDTENELGDLEAYKNLPGCCLYDHSMEMNQTGDVKSKDTH